MHMIFNDINVNGRQIREIEHYDVKKKIKLRFEIGLPLNETQFLKRKTKKKLFFSHKLMFILVNINGYWHIQNRFFL